MHCPNCGFQVEPLALECSRCTASFSSESHWKPVAERPTHVVEIERISRTPASLRLAFSGKVLALSALLGPLVAIMGIGSGSGMSKTPIMLLPIYAFGTAVALVSWVLFSLAFALIHTLQQRGLNKSLPLFAQLLLGAAFGAVSGFAAWGLFTCSAAAWVVGGWLPCLKVNAIRDYGLSLMPGLVCGVASVLLWGRREA